MGNCACFPTPNKYKKKTTISSAESVRLVCSLCKPKEQSKVALPEITQDQWSEYIRLFNNIGWNETLPESFEECQDDDEELYNLVQKIIEKTRNRPSDIRTKENFYEKMEKNAKFCEEHDRYIQDHLDTEIIKSDGNPSSLP